MAGQQQRYQLIVLVQGLRDWPMMCVAIRQGPETNGLGSQWALDGVHEFDCLVEASGGEDVERNFVMRRIVVKISSPRA